MNTKSVIRLILLIFAALCIAAGALYIAAYFEYLQSLEIGENFVKVFATDLSVYAVTFTIMLVVSFGLLLSNFLIVRTNAQRVDTTVTMYSKKPVLLVFSVLFSLGSTIFLAKGISTVFLPFINSEWFNLGDPIFNQDVGYYVFQRPFYIAVTEYLSILTTMLIFINVISYFLIYAGHDVRKLRLALSEKGVVMHIIVSIMLFFLVKAVSYQFAMESVIFNNHNGLVGAAYTDIAVWLKFYRLAPVLLLLSVALSIFLAIRSRLKGAVMAVCIYPVSFILVSVLAGIVQTMVVEPNEFAVSSQYIQNNIDFTRRAYNLSGAEQLEFNAALNLKADNIFKNLDTVNNVRLTESDDVTAYASLVQTGGDFYTLSGLDTAVYRINNADTVVYIGARELDSSKTEDDYASRRFKYTHGCGTVMSAVNNVTASGLPGFIIKDVPPRSSNGAPAVSEPRIYYGEHTNDYVVVGTSVPEYDELNSDGYEYNGASGIRLTFFNRLVCAINYGDYRLLFSPEINSGSRILTNRNISKRISTVAPFFTVDKNPYITIDGDGRLKWVVDLYTTSEWFPYSQFSGSYNYIRNSAKAVVDAYDGTVKLYVTDDSDPIVRCYMKIYPTLFETNIMPYSTATRVKYPEALFKVQANMLKNYHTTDARDFFDKNNTWVYSKQNNDTEKQQDVEPYYSFMSIDGGKNRLMMFVPYAKPEERDSMEAWLTADENGTLTVCNVQQNSNVYGTYRFESRINASPTAGMWLTENPGVKRGSTVVVPVDGNIMYLKPFYTENDVNGAKAYGLSSVALAYGDKLAFAPTLNECLKQLFGINSPVSNVADETIGDIITDVLESYDRVKEYSAANDWEGYGKAMSELEYNLANLRSAAKNEKPEQ